MNHPLADLAAAPLAAPLAATPSAPLAAPSPARSLPPRPLPDWLAQRRREVEGHRAVYHPLLHRLSGEAATRADFLAFRRHHDALVGCFTKSMERCGSARRPRPTRSGSRRCW